MNGYGPQSLFNVNVTTPSYEGNVFVFADSAATARKSVLTLYPGAVIHQTDRVYAHGPKIVGSMLRRC